MKQWIPLTTCFAALSLGVSVASGQGKSPRQGSVIIPDSNIQRPADIGVRSHTNYLIFVPAKKPGPISPQGETPGSIACIYKLVNSANYPNCAISDATTAPSGGSGIIAVVDAYDYPTAEDDFNYFSEHFGLPHGNTACSGGPCFTKVSATGGSFPRSNAGWALEAALDIEWAHAMAPSAQIFLVEAASSRFSDLLDAVDAATTIVATCNGACTDGTGIVSMSWGGSEFSQETTYDSHFDHPGIIYTAASGDSGGTPIWPCTSPNVVCAGGTTVNRADDGNFAGETAWSDSGGGPSVIESRPPFQDVISDTVRDSRGAPDFSFDSDPGSGVSVYDTTPYQGSSGWFVIGGTSAAAQGLAGIINLAGNYSSTDTTQDELGTIYGNFTNTSEFTDITSGSTSNCPSNIHRPPPSNCYSAGTGWDFVTGVGTNLGTNGK